jgi:hypothetical protein
MHAINPNSGKKAWHEKITRSGYFFGALLLHLIVLLLVATWVIWKAPPPPPTYEFDVVAVKPPAPPVQPPPSPGAASSNPQIESQPVEVQVPTPPNVMTTAQSSYTVDATALVNDAVRNVSDQASQGLGSGPGPGGGSTSAKPFGSPDGYGLQGYLYDFKQNQDHDPRKAGDPDTDLLWRRFVDTLWDTSLFEDFYRSPNALETNCFAITPRPSGDGPAAFGLASEVQPAWWLVYYQGRVIPPETGNYTFVGFGDDVLAVAMDGKVVLDGGICPMLQSNFGTLAGGLENTCAVYPNVWSSRHANTPNTNDGKLRIGQTFHATANVPIKMQVLIGDRGGDCAFFLLIKNEAKTYPTTPDGTPILPLFQLGPVHKVVLDGDHPPIAEQSENWARSQ